MDEKMEYPIYDTLTREQWHNCGTLHHIHEVASKITSLCVDIYENTPISELEEREELKTDLLISRTYQPYGQTLDLFYYYLQKWGQRNGQKKSDSGEEMAAKKKNKCLKNREILEQVVRDTVTGISSVIDQDLSLEPYESLSKRKWESYGQALRKVNEGLSLLDFIVNLDINPEDLPELENINTSYALSPSFGNWSFFTRNQLKSWVKNSSEDSTEGEGYRYDLDWK